MKAPLNAEPSKPAERREHHLPPKSYANAAHENLDGDAKNQSHTGDGQEFSGTDNGRPVRSKMSHRKPALAQVNGVKNQDEKHLVYEPFEDTNGEHLTSIEVSQEYALGLKQGQTERRKTEPEARDRLVSGRRAGTGWEKSG